MLRLPTHLSGLKIVESNYTNNSYDLTTNNLYVSGIFKSIITDNLNISYNFINTKLENYNTINTNLINNLTISQVNDIQNLNNLTITSNYINTDLQTFKSNQNIINNLVGVSCGVIDTNERNLSVSQTNFINSQNIENNLLQTQIDTAIAIGISGQITDTQLGVSLAVEDSKLGVLLGISMPQFLTRNETTLPSAFTTSSLTQNNSSNFQLKIIQVVMTSYYNFKT